MNTFFYNLEFRFPVACPSSNGRGAGGCALPPWTPSAGATGRRTSTPASCSRRAAGATGELNLTFGMGGQQYRGGYRQYPHLDMDSLISPQKNIGMAR